MYFIFNYFISYCLVFILILILISIKTTLSQASGNSGVLVWYKPNIGNIRMSDDVRYFYPNIWSVFYPPPYGIDVTYQNLTPGGWYGPIHNGQPGGGASPNDVSIFTGTNWMTTDNKAIWTYYTMRAASPWPINTILVNTTEVYKTSASYVDYVYIYYTFSFQVDQFFLIGPCQEYAIITFFIHIIMVIQVTD